MTSKPKIDKATISKLKAQIESLDIMTDSDPSFYAEEIYRTHAALAQILITTLTEIESISEVSEIIDKQLQEHAHTLAKTEDKNVIKLTLPPLIKNNKLFAIPAKKAAHLIADRTIEAQANALKDAPICKKNCTVVFVHHSPKPDAWDYDNLAFKVYLDQIALYFLDDDNAGNINLYQCSTLSLTRKTEVFIMPKSVFPDWIKRFNTIQCN